MSQMYAFMVEVNDLTANVVWANIPDANVPSSAVTQHVGLIDHDSLLNYSATEHFTQGAISIPLSQGANDVTATAAELNLLDLSGLTTGWVLKADSATTASWQAEAAEVNDLTAAVTWANVPNANITESSVTQHSAAIKGAIIVSETATNLADITHAINTGAAKVAGYQVWDSTNSQPVWAVGNADGSVWVDGAGTTVHTPV
jgi:hypothetical protein